MNFAQVKGITIPQGAVKRLAQGQTILWKKSGGVPIGYRRLTGIEFDGQVWYDSGMYLQGSDTLKFAFEASIACNVLGCYTDASAQTNYSLYVSTSSTAKYLRYNGGTYNSSITANTRYYVILTPTGSDGMKVDSTWAAKTFTTPTTMMIGTTSVGATSAKLTGALYGDIEVVGRERIIPVKRASDGAIGYWMESAGVFLANLGTGTPVPTGYIDPYDVEIEYLESAGTGAYIDSGIECTGDLSVELRAYWFNTDNTAICGGIKNISGSTYFRHHMSPRWSTNQNLYWYQSSSASSPSIQTNMGSANAWHTFKLNADTGSWDLNLGAKTGSVTPVAGSETTGKSYGIFARIGADGTLQQKAARFSWIKLSRGGVLLRDFIPVRIDTTGYLYDKVSGQLFGNAGTGDFILGNDI